MKILHLTDFHYRSDENSITKQNVLVTNLINSLKGEEIDILLFTGDLVNTGGNIDDFKNAYNSLLVKIAQSIGVNSSNIFICAGNHDVHRGQELHAIQSEFEKINSSNELEKFVLSQNGLQFKASLTNLHNYISFQNKVFEEKDIINLNAENQVNDLYTIHKREHKGRRIGIASINTAWRSFDSNKDSGNLFYPISMVQKVAETLKNEEFKILLLHHPISDLKPWNASEVEDIIHSEFHMMFSGHIHKRKATTHINNDEGIFCSVAPATLSLYDSSSTIGYSIFDIDLDTFEVVIHNKQYVENENIFYVNPTKIHSEIPLQGLKRQQNEFRKKMKTVLQQEIIRANELFISSGESEAERLFLELFTTPILKSKTKAQIANSNENPLNISINDLFQKKEHIVIFGKDKSGKTSLLYKVLLELLEQFSQVKIIPYYIDAKLFKSSIKKIDFIQLMSRYYQVTKSQITDCIEKYQVKILIDNYDPTNELFSESIAEFSRKYQNIKVIITTDETISRPFEGIFVEDFKYEKIYIHEISRNEIRELTNKWPSIPNSKKEQVLEKISQVFTQLNMPLNYWTVSLFLWIFEKTNEANFHNNFELIQLYIDNLLDRKRLALDRTLKIDYEEFKTYLGELAHHLIINHKDTTYSCDYASVISFTSKYREKNKRFVIAVEDIVRIIIEKGILKKTSDERYTFRLNGVFEYFIAFYMKDNSAFTEEVINDFHFYLSFSNELELYSGFNKKDVGFVTKIFNKTKDILNPTNQKYDQLGTKDNILLEKISEVFDVSLPINQLSKVKNIGLSPESQDRLIQEFTPVISNNTDVKEKKFYDSIEVTSENHEKALFILSRVVRNSSINDDNLTSEVIDFILNSACNLGFLIIDEVNLEDKNNHIDLKSEEEGILIMQLLTNFMPLLVQTFLFDALAQNNLERIFSEKIENLKQNKSENQFKLQILYFLLLDLDVKNNKKMIDEIIENINLPILKQTTLIKLYSYLMFKSYNHPEFEKFIQEKIQKQSFKINSNTDLGTLHKNFANTSTIVRLKNRPRN